MWHACRMDRDDLLHQLRFAGAWVSLTVALGWLFAGTRSLILLLG
jgi:hypothetical protein